MAHPRAVLGAESRAKVASTSFAWTRRCTSSCLDECRAWAAQLGRWHLWSGWAGPMWNRSVQFRHKTKIKIYDELKKTVKH